MSSTAPTSSTAPAAPPLRATRALTHPLWWVALALLAANDHLFKGAGVLPAALTGKLSDFAGLLVAPVVLAALIGVRGRRGWLLSHLAVGLGFAAINLSPAIARMVEAATVPTPFPWWITVDPTDLVALPMLAVSALVFGAWCRRPVALRPALSRLGLAVGGVACVATSPPPEEAPPPPEEWQEEWPETVRFSSANARIALINTTNSRVVVRTRALRPSIEIDCDAVARDPALHLDTELFGPVMLWSLEPGTLLPDEQLDGSRRACRIALVSVDGTTRLLFADDREYPVHSMRHEVGAPLLDRGFVGIGGADGRATLQEHPTLFPAPRGGRIDPESICDGPEPGAGLAWTEPPLLQGVLVDHSVGPDGCHALDIGQPGALDGEPEEPPPTARWYVCAPGAPLDLPLGTELALSGSTAEGGAARMVISTPDRTISLLRIIAITSGSTGLDELRVAAPTGDDACRAAWRDSCGGVMAPLVLHDARGPLPFGEPTRVGADSVITVIRAQDARVSDTECDPWGAVGARYELVIETLHDDVAPEAAE